MALNAEGLTRSSALATSKAFIPLNVEKFTFLLVFLYNIFSNKNNVCILVMLYDEYLETNELYLIQYMLVSIQGTSKIFKKTT